MKLVEIFSSIDGEGSRAGYLATFIRTVGCNLRCVFCDTAYSFEPESTNLDLTINEIVDRCKKLGNYRITLTGGEPLIQPDAYELITALLTNGFEVNVETNGSIKVDLIPQLEAYRTTGQLFFTYDFKCPSSGMFDKMNIETFYNLHKYDLIKFVVGSEEDLNVMKDTVESLELVYKDKNYINANINSTPYINYIEPKQINYRYYVSPVFGDIEPVDIVNYLDKNNMQCVRLQLQIHKIVWDVNKRGV